MWVLMSFPEAFLLFILFHCIYLFIYSFICTEKRQETQKRANAAVQNKLGDAPQVFVTDDNCRTTAPTNKL